MWLFSWSNMQLQVEKKPSFLSPAIGSIRNIYGKTQKKMVLPDNSFLTLKMEILNSLEQIDQIDNWVCGYEFLAPSRLTRQQESILSYV